MKAAFYETTGPADAVFQISDMDDPIPATGEVLVRVRASGVNPTDTKVRGGTPGRKMGHARIIPHHDGAGEIVATGPGVDAARRDQRCWMHSAQFERAFGTAAQYVALPAHLVLPLPDTISFAEGAALGVPVMTAWNGVMGDGHVAGRTVFVAGGAGAVGHYAIQIAKLGGARVAASVSSPAKVEHARAAGADLVIDYNDPDAEALVQYWSAGNGIDHFLDVNTTHNAGFAARVMGQGGRIVSYGSASNSAGMPIRDFRQRNVSIRFLFIHRLDVRRGAEIAAAVGGLLRPGVLSHRIAQRLPLDQIAEAHRMVEEGRVMGKVVLDMPDK